MAVATNCCFARPSSLIPQSSSLLPMPTAVAPMAPMAPLAPSISHAFSKLKQQGKVAFIPYITAGDPDLSTTAKMLKLLDRCGADVIELGMPFSDPFADGPIIQASTRRALANGTKFQAVISMLEEVAPQLSCPIALFSYYNMILKQTVGKFMSALKYAGVQGLVVPDLPFDEIGSLRMEAAKKNIEMVLLTTPITPTNQMKAIVNASEGFVYLETSKPVAVGFGISKAEHIKQLSRWGADGVIMGSAIVKLLGEAKSAEEGLNRVETFIRSLKVVVP